MKKTLLFSALCISLVVLLVLSLTLLIGAAESTVTVTEGGNTLAYALNNVADGGTIVIEGTYTIPADFSWTAHNKTVTLTGGVLDFTNFGADGHFNINDNVTFSDIELKFATIDWNAEGDDGASAKSSSSFKRTNIYANGHRVTIDSNVTFTEGATYNTNVCLFGGSKGGTVNGNTNLTVLAGWYTYIFGGGHGGTINGSTYVTVGGTVNSTAKISNHKSNYNAYGGGWGDNITGSSNLTVQDSAKLIYAYGGSHGSGSVVGGTTNVLFTGGTLMSIYGAHNSGANTGTASNVLMTGGTVDQIFGGSNGASFGTSSKLVDANVTLLGGTVTRRIYGGCYNNFVNYGLSNWQDLLAGKLGTWSSTYQVFGNITVIISDAANLALNTDNDRALYARSRLSIHNNTGAIPANENGKLIFLGSHPGNNKIGAIDSTMKTIMSSVTSAADEIHTLTFTASGAVITQTCTQCSTAHSATATLRTTYDATYTGEAIENVEIVYSDGWMLEKDLTVTYANNVNVGTATATTTGYGATATLSFTIGKQKHNAPVASLFTVTNETIKGKHDGAISGFAAGMEYSTDGVSYTPITGDLTGLGGITYYVRYAEDDTHSPSDPITLTVADGRMLTITFKADGRTVATKTVTWGATLENVPDAPIKTGYTKTPPVWMNGSNVAVFTDIYADMTVTAKYTLNRYTVIFVIDGVQVAEKTVTHGSALHDAPAIPTKAGYNKTAPVWMNGEVEANLATITDDMTLTALYTKNQAGVATDTSKDATASLGDGWKDAILTDADKQEMELGESVRVNLQSAKVTLNADQQSALDAVLNGYVAEHYLQLSFFKKVGNASEAQIDTLDSELTVTLKIPAEILSKERQYKLFAICDGVATEVDADYNAEAGTMTVKVKDFSTVYAFSYQEPLGEVTPTGGNSTVVIIVIAAVVVVGGGVAAGIVVSKKKKKA